MSAFQRLNDYVDAFAVDDEDRAGQGFWGEFASRADELPPERAELFDDIEHLGSCSITPTAPAAVSIAFLAGAQVTGGERAFLAALRRFVDAAVRGQRRPAGSLADLRETIEGGTVTVNERQASRTIGRHDTSQPDRCARPIGRPGDGSRLAPPGAADRDPLLARSIASAPVLADTRRSDRVLQDLRRCSIECGSARCWLITVGGSAMWLYCAPSSPLERPR